VLAKVTLYDGISDALRKLSIFGIPFFLGRVVYKTPKSLRDLLVVIAGAGLAYVPLIGVELWMSPQMHNWIYGFHQHSFVQAMRGSGYRPVVFMAHGLAVALMVAVTATAAACLARTRPRRAAGWWKTGLLTVVLVLCKSAAALTYTLVTVPLSGFARARTQLAVAASIATLSLTYPLLGAIEALPNSQIVEVAARFSHDRAESMAFRARNEEALLRRARARLVFGWGTNGRNRIYTSTGEDVSVTDGAWVIVLGQSGMAGFVGIFGLMTFPVFMAAYRLHRAKETAETLVVASVSLILATFTVDLLPNGLFHTFPFFVAGALYGALGRASPRHADDGGR